MSRDLLTLDRAADEMDCSVRTLRRLIATKELRAYRLGNAGKLIRIDCADLDKLLRPVVS